MSAIDEELPDWDRLLTAAARLQKMLPDAVLVGGTAAALHAGHRFSHDADHVLTDLRARFDSVLRQLEAVSGWETARVRPPVLILGSLDGIETGVRQLIRSQPLETTVIEHRGAAIAIPTEAEILRIKAVLILRRNATRDYLDFAALASRMSVQRLVHAMEPFDRLYPQENRQSPLQQLLAQLSSARPGDLADTGPGSYRGLAPELSDWNRVSEVCAMTAQTLFDGLCSPPSPPQRELSRPKPDDAGFKGPGQ